MPPAADDPQSDRVSAELRESPSAGSSDDTAPSHAGDTAEPVAPGESAPSAALHRRRRRRRRRPQIDPGATSEAMGPAAVEVSLDSIAESADPRPDEAAAETNLASGAAAPASDRPHRRRRRRRPPPAVLGSAPAALGSALPPLDAAPASGIGDAAAPEGSAEDTAGLASEGRSERPALHLRRPVRGRRQLPRPPGLQPGAAENTPALGTAAEGEGLAAAPGGEAPSGTPRPEGEVPRRRRRRRPGPRPPGAAAASETQSLEAPQQFGRPPRGRDRRRGDERSRTAQPDRNRDGQPQRRGPGGGSRDREAGGPGRRERDDRAARGRGPDGRREGQRGRGRDAAPRRVELKLYTLESMVDRGFEDVPDEAEESGSRRVHWTIIKRTVADQKSGKPISTTYVLQREDSETEFPNLGTARAAANKTIIHPEKLTMSKAEHAAAKNSK